MQSTSGNDIMGNLVALSSDIDGTNPRVSMILAAGHGKRIKSEKSKMLHKVWGVPTVQRVVNAACDGLESDNQVIVAGKKAREVATTLGMRPHRMFAFQSEQKGTGDAVRIGLKLIIDLDYDGDVYVFPGDMGLLNSEEVRQFRKRFEENLCDMIVLTGEYHGDPELNYYGRILRVPEYDINGNASEDDFDKVIEIKEHTDIIEMSEGTPYQVEFNQQSYAFFREELLHLREFNTGIYAFRSVPFKSCINMLTADNVQGEYYITDMIKIFNQQNLTVRSAPASDSSTVLGFNNKSVLQEMDGIARERVYDQLKDLISISDKDDFYIADEVVDHILELDETSAPLDIKIGKGVYINVGVRLNNGVIIKNRAVLDGNIELGKNIKIFENVIISTYPEQRLSIGGNTQILQGNLLKGELSIGSDCKIESGVNITGSDEFPTRLGNGVLIKGTTYIFGSTVENDVCIEHSVLKCKRIERTVQKNGSVKAIRWVMPLPEGLDSIQPLNSHPAG